MLTRGSTTWISKSGQNTIKMRAGIKLVSPKFGLLDSEVEGVGRWMDKIHHRRRALSRAFASREIRHRHKQGGFP
jgi:hypothetical protein